jgi:acetate---CoA ligase (ADP-forming)
VAVIGASADPLKIGGRPLQYLRLYGYRGRVVPVNPNRQEVQALQCVPHLSLEDPMDLAIVAAPAAAAGEAVSDCLRAGCKAIILFSAGFAELDDAGRQAQQHLARAASDAGIALLGPNCLGIINAHTRLAATFTTALENSQLPVGAFSYMGQSGALGAYWIEKAVSAGLGISKWITTGNEAQVSLADALWYLAEDSHTRLIGAYVEDLKQPESFLEAAQVALRAGKTILAIKSGRSEGGRRAVAAHTGADAGSDAYYQSLLDESGITRVASLTEMIDTARLLLSRTPPRHVQRLAVVTVSGGAGALICDAAHDAGLSVPDLPAEVTRELDALLPKFVLRRNPIDVTGAIVSNTPMLGEVLVTLARSDAFDSIVLFLGLMGSIQEGLISAVTRAQKVGKPLILIWMGATPESRHAIEALGIPVFTEIPSTLSILAKATSSRARPICAK